MILLLEHHKQAKREIVSRLQQLADVADQIGMVSLARDIRTNRIPKIEAERFHLVVLGEFNHGKSTFVNALLGADVLPAGITPTTAALNHVVWAPAPTARVVLTTGESKLLDPSAIKEWVTVAGGHASEVAYVELGYPSPLLTNNVTLVDTPGVNDLNEQRAEVTYGYVPRADAVVFLLDAGQALKESEREFLRSRVLESARDRLIFVLGKMDLLSADEKSAVIDYVRRGLADLVPDAPGGPVMFPLAARDWLLRKDPASGMPALLEHLGTFLAQDRAQILLDNAAADASRTASYLGNNLGVRMAACAMDLAELEAKVDQVRAQLETSKRKLDELHVRIDAEAQAIKAQIALDLDAFAKAFVLALPDQIDAVDADDLKRYLPSFIEDKFKEWAELEGAKLAAMMERLAEEVISITNENLAAVTAAVADRLGPGDAPIDIRVDSFKYDVGVYAVGALGTTVMLFVNALAGGLLTLAAPILAIVLKSKVAGDVRKQAKEQVPRAVLGAAEAMKPHFDRCVDDFGKRLSEFVTGAGNTLYRGISEVLDRTIRERRERAGNTEGLKEATGEQLTHVLAIRAGLDHLRAGVWGSAEPGPDAATPASRPRDPGPDDGSN